VGCAGSDEAGIWLNAAVDDLRTAAPRTRITAESPSGRQEGGFAGDLLEQLESLKGKDLDILVSEASRIPLSLSEGLHIGAVLKRGNPFDALISSSEAILEDFPVETLIEVCNPVTRSQLLYFRPDLKCIDRCCGFRSCYRRMIRGITGGFVLSASVVEALNQQEKVAEVFTSSICMPAAGQGAMALITRKEDGGAGDLVNKLNHEPTLREIAIERMFLRHMDDNGYTGVLCRMDESGFNLSAAWTTPDGSDRIERRMRSDFGEEDVLAEKMARELMEAGGSGYFTENIFTR